MSNRRIAAASLTLGTIAFLAVAIALLAAGLDDGRFGGDASRDRVREIRLVARDMAFYREGGETPNPTLTVRQGERVRITLRNAEPGMLHDLAAAELGAATPVLESGSTASVELTVPRRRGTYDYVCTLHPVLMRGRIDVR